MEHDVQIDLIAIHMDREDPAGALEEQVELLLVVDQLCGDVKDVLLTAQWTVTILCSIHTRSH